MNEIPVITVQQPSTAPNSAQMSITIPVRQEEKKAAIYSEQENTAMPLITLEFDS